jgi:ubiquinone/menaquinone biosynthesis C-methylase UbiE
VLRIILVALATVFVAGPAASQQHGKLFPPENLGLLEGPDRELWQRPEQIMDALSIAEGSVVADLGAGSGWFTIRLANRVGPNGKVFAEDIQPEMIGVIRRRVNRENLQRRVEVKLGKPVDPELPPNVLDAALIVDSYYEMEQPVVLLRNLARALKKNGRIGIVNFTKAGGGPGPPMEERVDPERVIREARTAGLTLIAQPNFLRYQYMLVFAKTLGVAANELPNPWQHR